MKSVFKKINIVFGLLGLCSLIFGIVGVFLPLLPTTPFLILAAFLFSKSNPRFDAWLVAHPRFGPPIRDWRERRAISSQNKWIASLLLGISWASLIWLESPLLIIMILAILFTALLTFIWTRASS